MTSAPIERIFWDWDGVLGTQRFWQKSMLKDEKLLAFTNFLFSEKERTREWMRGARDVAGLAEEYGTAFTRMELGSLLAHDWAYQAINETIFNDMQAANPVAKHYIVTDNMDVFNDFAQSNAFVRNNFVRVFNSSDYGVLKDDDPSLYEIVLCELGLSSFAGCLVVDDSATNCKRFQELGGRSIFVERQPEPLR